jgi:hypothetical protein
MNRLAVTLPLAALAVLAGCATEHKVAPAPAPVVVSPAPPPVTSGGTVVVPPQTSNSPAVVVPQTGTSAVVVAPAQPQPLRAGTGRIESLLDIPASAAAGSSVPDANKRVGIRMDDGTLQYVDTHANDLAIGDRVSITSDGYLRHPAP